MRRFDRARTLVLSCHLLLLACGDDPETPPVPPTAGAGGQRAGAAGTFAGFAGTPSSGTGGVQPHAGSAGTGAGQAGAKTGGAGSGGAGGATAGGASGQAGAGAGGTSGQGGGGASGQGGSNAFVPTTCDQARGSIGCCVGDRVYRGLGAGLPPEVLYCDLNGQTCGWDAIFHRYTCQDTPSTDPTGAFPGACPSSPGESFCAGSCQSSSDCLPGQSCHPTTQLCVDCLDNSQCGATAQCFEGECHDQCSLDAECGSGRCHPTLHMCVACAATLDCPYSDICDPSNGTCVGCRSDDDCPSQIVPVQGGICQSGQICKTKKINYRCNAEKKCEQRCDTDKDCDTDEVCHPLSQRCIACFTDQHCIDHGLGYACDVSTGLCDPCQKDQDCGEGYRCQDEACQFFCTKDAHCASSEPHCNVSNGQCGECVSDADCTDPAAPHCQDAFQCVECLSNDQCGPGGTCEPWGGCGYHCTSSQDCKNPATPACLPSGECGECYAPGDCKDPAKPYCNQQREHCGECLTDFHCAPDQRCDLTDPVARCTSQPFACEFPTLTDQNNTRLDAQDATPAQTESEREVYLSVCKTELGISEVDWVRFEASAGSHWTIRLTEEEASSFPRLQLEVFDPSGLLLGQSRYQSPQLVELTYLPEGSYLVRVSGASSFEKTTSATLQVSRQPGACSSDGQCTESFETQTLRPRCDAGSCVHVTAPTSQGGLCDSHEDCPPGLICAGALAPYASSAATRALCTKECVQDTDCTAGEVCHELPLGHACLPPCSQNTDCGAYTYYFQPSSSYAWAYATCSQGRCQ